MKRMNLPMILQPFQCEDLVRLGKNYDGGYLVNQADIDKTTKLISFGVKDDWSFEEDFLKLNDCPCVAYDGSVTDDIKFFTGKNTLVKQNVGTDILLSDILSPEDKNVFLKCDIEGDEYKLLADIIKNTSRLSGLVIEFHGIANYHLFNQLTGFIAKINQKLVHAHPNTWGYIKVGDTGFLPDVIELSFTSSSNIELNSELQLPHRMDMPNNPAETDFVVTF